MQTYYLNLVLCRRNYAVFLMIVIIIYDEVDFGIQQR